MAKAKEIEGLDCGAGATLGMRLVLLTRLEEMCAFRSASLDWTSDEGVHDMRVGSRRLRSVLRDFVPHMRVGKRFEEARDELKDLARVLGSVRDEDVAIHALEKLKEEEPEASAGIEHFADERAARREGSRVELARALEEESFESLRRRVAGAFERATGPRSGRRGDDGEPSFREVGRKIVERLWEELRERGPDIYRPLKSNRLHKLRIRAKRLRYAFELFAPCFGEGAKALAHEIAELQTALGDLHDCDEWVEEFGHFLSRRGAQAEACAADDSIKEKNARSTVEKREAAYRLLEHFESKRARHYAEALAIWRGWERDDFASRIASVVGAGGQEEESEEAQAG